MIYLLNTLEWCIDRQYRIIIGWNIVLSRPISEFSGHVQFTNNQQSRINILITTANHHHRPPPPTSASPPPTTTTSPPPTTTLHHQPSTWHRRPPPPPHHYMLPKRRKWGGRTTRGRGNGCAPPIPHSVCFFLLKIFFKFQNYSTVNRRVPMHHDQRRRGMPAPRQNWTEPTHHDRWCNGCQSTQRRRNAKTTTTRVGDGPLCPSPENVCFFSIKKSLIRPLTAISTLAAETTSLRGYLCTPSTTPRNGTTRTRADGP